MNREKSNSKPFDGGRGFQLTAAPSSNWKFGDGITDLNHRRQGSTIEIDPHDAERASMDNYHLLISAIIPRPIALLSTVSADGKSANLAPFSYFTVVSHDPPVFVIGFAGGFSRAKDSLRNLMDTKECTINIISEDMLQAANSCALDAPYGVSEWDYSGLTQASSSIVCPKRVAESRFAMEGRLTEIKEFESRKVPGTSNSAMAIIQGLNFWVWKELGKEESGSMEVDVLRPVARLGGSTYARVLDGIDIERPKWQ